MNNEQTPETRAPHFRAFWPSLEAYFASGWAPFIPYLILYLAAWGLGWEASPLRIVFCALHGINVSLLALCVLKRETSPSWGSTLFWSSLLLSCILPGAYLEFPADPWEHLERIYSWDSATLLGDHPQAFKFAYYFSWTWAGWFEPLYRRFAMDLVSTGWQMLLFYQWYLFVRALGIERKWAYLQVVAFICLFGTNLFGFRYYALSSTPLAFVGYLALLRWLLTHKLRWSFTLFTPLFLLLLVAFNHKQCLIFSMLSASVIIVYRLLPFLSRAQKIRVVQIISSVVVFSLFAGYFIHLRRPELYSRMTIETISILGTFQPWQNHSRFLETLGVHGVVSLGFAVLLLRQYPLPALLTLAPLGILLFPPVVLFIATYFQVDTPYRILYAMPTSLMFMIGVQWGVSRFKFFQCRERLQPWVVTIVLLAFAIPYTYPWRGRLMFHVHQPKPRRSLEQVEQVLGALQQRSINPKTCPVLFDNYTGYGIHALLGLPTRSIVDFTIDYPERNMSTEVSYSRRSIGNALLYSQDPHALDGERYKKCKDAITHLDDGVKGYLRCIPVLLTGCESWSLSCRSWLARCLAHEQHHAQQINHYRACVDYAPLQERIERDNLNSYIALISQFPCGIVMPNLDEYKPLPNSRIASFSHHWFQHEGALSYLISDEASDSVYRALDHGWTKTPLVGPFYLLENASLSPKLTSNP